MNKQYQSLFNRIYRLALMRAEPFEHFRLLLRIIVVPLSQTGSIHPCVLLPQASWTDVITFITSSLTLDQQVLLGNDLFGNYIFSYVTKGFENTNKCILPASTFLPPNLSPLLFAFWQRLVTYSLINDVIDDIYEVCYGEFSDYRDIYSLWYSRFPYAPFIQYPFESSHATIRDKVLWFKPISPILSSLYSISYPHSISVQ